MKYFNLKCTSIKLGALIGTFIIGSSFTLNRVPSSAIVSSENRTNKIHYNIQDGYVAEEYDVVAYFSKKAVEGKKTLVLKYDGVKFKFSTKANYTKFKNNPKKYVPQYGGWCAYAMAKNKKVSIDPDTYEIRGGKLYLFYNSFFNNTYDKWKSEGAVKLRIKADKNWKTLKNK